MLMRSTRTQKIKRNGVYITFAGEKIWYMKPEETILHLGEEVYVRYDPADLKTVRLYNTKDQYLFTWELADALMLDYLTSDKMEIANAEQTIRHTRTFVRNQAKGITADLTNAQRIDYLDATIRRAGEARKKHFQIRMPKTIEPVRAGEPLEESRMVSGSEFLPVSIDLKKMQQNAKKRKEE